MWNNINFPVFIQSAFNCILGFFYFLFFLSQWKWTKEQSPNLSPEFGAQLSQEAAFI
jgi:hypothetical protein